MFTAMDHIDVVVRDIHEATRNYTRIVGVEPTQVANEQVGQGFVQSAFPVGGSVIYLVQPTSSRYQAGAAMQRSLERRGEGVHVVALAADSVDRLMEAVRAQGEEVIPSAHSHSFFVHPRRLHGVLYQFMER